MPLTRNWRLFLLGQAEGPIVGQVTRHSMEVGRVLYSGICAGWAIGLEAAALRVPADIRLDVALLSLAFVAMIQAQRVGTGYAVEERGPTLVHDGVA
jgi:hypothetical protein